MGKWLKRRYFWHEELCTPLLMAMITFPVKSFGQLRHPICGARSSGRSLRIFPRRGMPHLGRLAWPNSLTEKVIMALFDQRFDGPRKCFTV